MQETDNLIPMERIESSILLIRGQKVMLDADLAAIYAVSTKRLNEQVKRNLRRFPPDFMFQLERPIRLVSFESLWGASPNSAMFFMYSFLPFFAQASLFYYWLLV